MYKLLLFAAYGLFMNVYLALHLVCLDCLPVVAQANHVTHWITLSAVIALVVGVVFRLNRRVLAWIAPGINGAGSEFTVATFNALDDITIAERADDDDTIRVIAALDVDIIAVQELGPILRYRLEHELDAEYPYQVHKVRHGYEGLGLLSRYPILESEVHIVVDAKQDYHAMPRYIRAVIDLDGRQVVVYNFHPTRPRFRPGVDYDAVFNQMNVRAILDRIEQEEKANGLPVLLLCDCNATPHSRAYNWLDDRLGNAFAASGWGFGLTFPANDDFAPFPLVRIDHVWYSDGFAALDAGVGGDSGGSDHFPLWARLVLRDS